jgi:hypothetical protein
MLRSLVRYRGDMNLGDVRVLYAATQPVHVGKYALLEAEYPEVRFVSENKFKFDVLHLLSVFSHVLFLKDDHIYIRTVPIGAAVEQLEENRQAVGFSLRLGANAAHCNPAERASPQPAFQPAGAGMVAFEWGKAEWAHAYPLEMSGVLYRLSDLRAVLMSAGCGDPVALEAAVLGQAWALSGKLNQLLCFETPATFAPPSSKSKRS